MATGIRIFWLLALCFFIVGCGGYRPAGLALTGDPGDLEQEPDEGVIEPGDQVRVTMMNGRQITGIYVAHDQTSLTLGQKAQDQEEGDPDYADFGPESDTRHNLALTEIKSLERFQTKNDGAIIIGLGVVIVLGSIIGNSMQNSLDGNN